MPSPLKNATKIAQAVGISGESKPRRRKAIPMVEFMTWEFSDDEQLLGPVITAGSSGMLSAQRGLGKSLLGMHIGYAVAAGKRLQPWGRGGGVKVVYLDGEMKAKEFHGRMGQIRNRDPFQTSQARFLQNFHLISRSAHSHDIGYIDTEEGQQAIEGMFPDGVGLLIIDNLSAWKMSGGEDGNAFAPIKRWLIHLRTKGIAVLLIHHTGKNGSNQRGTSIHEDMLDYSILLREDKAGKPKNGTSFMLEHTKLRGLHPDLPKVCRYTFMTDQAANVMDHSYADVENEVFGESDAEAVELLKQGMKGTEIAECLGISVYTVSRIKTSLPSQVQAEIEAAQSARTAVKKATGRRA